MISGFNSRRRLPIFQEISVNEEENIESPIPKKEDTMSTSSSASSHNLSDDKENLNASWESEASDYRTIMISLHPDCDPNRLTSLLARIGEVDSISQTKNLYVVIFSSLRSALKAKSILGIITKKIKCSSKAEPLDITNAGKYTGIRRRRSAPFDKELFKIDTSRINSGLDCRTTIMIKNIPNKYTQQMLLEAINKDFAGSYNFLYLPIDFQNKCNVGYAFINFKTPKWIVSFSDRFCGKKWGRFNSKKVCALAYARIQGFKYLVRHFQTSEVMVQPDSRIKPIIIVD